MANFREERERQLTALALLPAILLDTQYRRATELDPTMPIPLGKTARIMIREILTREFPPLIPRPISVSPGWRL